MKHLLFILGLLCACIGIGRAGYVLHTGGAVIAMLWSLIFLPLFRSYVKKR